jgi:MbtH protein
MVLHASCALVECWPQGHARHNPMDEVEVKYQVVLNHEGQYSIWLADEGLPSGWTADGKAGSKEECLQHIAAVWTDLRPASARVSQFIGEAA